MTSASTEPTRTEQPFMDASSRTAAAAVAIAATRDFSKSLVTLTASILAVYATLLSWTLPRGAIAVAKTAIDAPTALCLAMPILDLGFAIVAYALGFFGAGFDGGFAPYEFNSMERFHRVQIRWIRTGSIFVALGLIAAFAILGQFLISIGPSTIMWLEGFAAVCSVIVALVALNGVRNNARRAWQIIALLIALCLAIVVFLAHPSAFGIAALIVVCLIVLATIALCMGLFYVITHARS